MKTGVLALMFTLVMPLSLAAAEGGQGERLFVHLKTSLKHDDAQVCVAYNVIWAALRQGMTVDVLVDADGVNTFKRGWFSARDSIEDYKIPENLRQAIAGQFGVPLETVPRSYGDYLVKLHAEGARFHVNSGFLIVAGIAADPDRDMGKLAGYVKDIFEPITLKEMLALRRQADLDFTY